MSWVARRGWQVHCQLIGVGLMAAALTWMTLLLILGGR